MTLNAYNTFPQKALANKPLVLYTTQLPQKPTQLPQKPFQKVLAHKHATTLLHKSNELRWEN